MHVTPPPTRAPALCGLANPVPRPTAAGLRILRLRVQDCPIGKGLRDYEPGLHRKGSDGDGRQAPHLSEELEVS